MAGLGKYEIIEEIGRGGFAVVYKARDTVLERVIALKVLHPQLTVDPKFVERFKREARTAAGLDHPHIATVYEVGEIDGQLYIAMELARGPSLAERIRQQGSLAWEEALEILGQLASALDYAHERGLVHRDIKPSNVLLDPDKSVLLGDFGLSKMIESSGHSLTASGGVLGTPAYIAPEIWLGERPTPASDIYALGCVFYEMITGDVLFGSDSPLIVMKRHDEGPQLGKTKIGAGSAPALLKALEKSPNERHQSAGGFAAVLQSEWKRVKAEEKGKRRRERIANLLIQGKHAAREKRWDEAIASFEAVLGIDSENQTAHRGLARARRVRERAMGKRSVPGWAWGAGGLVILLLLGGSGLLWGMPKQGPLAAFLSSPTATPTGTPTTTPMATPTGTPTSTPTPNPTSTPTVTPTSLPAPELTAPEENAGYYTTSWVPLAWDWSQELGEGQRFVVLIQNVDETVVLSHTVEVGEDLKHSFRSGDEGLEPGKYTWLVCVEQQVAREWRAVAKSEPRTLRVVQPSDTPTPVPADTQPTATDIWNFRVTEVSNSEILVIVDYTYGEPCDEPWIGAGVSIGAYTYSPVRFSQDYGSAAISLSFTGTGEVTSSQITVVMYGCFDTEHQFRYEEYFDYVKVWSAP